MIPDRTRLPIDKDDIEETAYRRFFKIDDGRRVSRDKM